MTIALQDTGNFLVPAQGGTNVMSLIVGPSGDITNNVISFQSLSQQLGTTLFTPQSCTIDASNASGDVTFYIRSLNYTRKIVAGSTPTFQFPALQNLTVELTPTGTDNIPTFWYNYPALPDEAGNATVIDPTSNAILTTIANEITALPNGDIGTDYSANAPATLAHLIATIPANAARKGFVVQNLDVNPVMVLIDNGSGGVVTKLILNGASVAGFGGGSIDYSGMPTQGRIQVYSATAGVSVSARDM